MATGYIVTEPVGDPPLAAGSGVVNEALLAESDVKAPVVAVVAPIATLSIDPDVNAAAVPANGSRIIQFVPSYSISCKTPATIVGLIFEPAELYCLTEIAPKPLTFKVDAPELVAFQLNRNLELAVSDSKLG